MRALSAANDAILRGSRRFKTRIQVKDSGGTFRDLTTYAGLNMLVQATWGEAVDDPGIEWKATLVREENLLSLSPLMQTSGLNRNFNIATAYNPLLKVGRAMKIEWALQAEEDPQAPSWQLGFTGFVDTIDFDGDELELTGRGEQAKLVDAYIERERVYAFGQGANADRGCYIFEPSRAYAVGDRLVPTGAKQNGHFYRCTTAGTSASTEPTWATGGGSTTSSGTAIFTESGATSDSVGTAVETVMQQLIDDTLGAGVYTLACPVSPVWNVKLFLVARQLLWDELRLLADQIGWCLRFKFDSGSGTMKLTLYDPNRSTTTSLRTFLLSEPKIRRAQTSIFDIRNVVQVVYSDSQDLDSSGYPKRKTVSVSDSTSITAYGRRFCEISESSSSNIDTSAEATTLANAVLGDLREPEVDFEVEVPLFPFAELTDLYTLAANGAQFDTDQKLAVVSYRHSHDADESITTLRIRGRPATGKSTWLQRCSDSENGEVHALTDLQNPSPLTISVDNKPVGGARLQLSTTRTKDVKDLGHEVHVSTSSAFTPDSSTLVQVVTGKNQVEIGNLDPAKVHYAKVVPLTLNAERPVRGQPSEQVSFTPGRGQATHLNPNVEWGRLPLNGGFETQLDAAGAPDFWTVDGWGTKTTEGTSSGLEGARYLKLVTVGAVDSTGIFSAEFSVRENKWYSASFWRKCVAGSGNNLALYIAWFDISHAAISQDTLQVSLTDNVGTWVRSEMPSLVPPSGARFAVLGVAISGGASGREAHIESVRFDSEEPWHIVNAGGEPAFANSWVNNGGAFSDAKFKRTPDDWIEITGLIKNGTIGLAAFTLPAGYRPAANFIIATTGNGAFAELQVQSNGDVVPLTGNNAYFSIHTRFKAA